jgi:hypothetical protein
MVMGHVAAPEYMHALTAILAGHEDYVTPQYKVHPGVTTHIWIDNIRWTGPCNHVVQARKMADGLAKTAGATWKPADTKNEVRAYDWLGVTFNHEDHTVGLSGRNATKLPKVIPAEMSFAELEVLIGRLIYAAGATRSTLAHYYFGMKWVRRRCNAFNRGLIALDELLAIPSSVRTILQRWLQDAKKRTVVPRTPEERRAVLCVDASVTGWGGILITSDQQVYVAAGSWLHRMESRDINELEGHGLSLAAAALEAAFKESGDDSLLVLVDNTSIQHGARRGIARSMAVNEAIIPALDRMKAWNVPVWVDYVKSAMNPADGPSRAQPSVSALALGEANERRGGGSGPATPCTFIPIANTRSRMHPRCMK